jgi:hypothetical protein
LTKMGWTTFWAIFSQTPLVTLRGQKWRRLAFLIFWCDIELGATRQRDCFSSFIDMCICTCMLLLFTGVRDSKFKYFWPMFLFIFYNTKTMLIKPKF